MIRGERVFLRASERSDIPLFVQWFNNAETASFITMRAPMSAAMEEGWFERMLAAQGKDGYHFVMCLVDGGQPIGTIGLFDLDHLNGSAGVGIVIGEGVERHAAYRRGQHHDVQLMSILCNEWAALQRPRSWELSV